MKRLATILIILFLSHVTDAQTELALEKGISLELARSRKENISNINYKLKFIIPGTKQPIVGSEEVTLRLKSNKSPLVIDFKTQDNDLPEAAIRGLKVNGKYAEFEIRSEHLVISPKYLVVGVNKLDIEFVPANKNLNRRDSFMYALCVPEHARTVFPCFDQPNLKATYVLTLDVPREWTAVSAAPIVSSETVGKRKLYEFAKSASFSTYLFSFVTGKLQEATIKSDDGRILRFYYNDTDKANLARNVQPILDEQVKTITALEEYTQVRYPFEKYDFVSIPGFQFSGMEHTGNILYKADDIMLQDNPTTADKFGRVAIMGHETAHMWFGNLVTMDWFDDVWMKEVFANFMAAKLATNLYPEQNQRLFILYENANAAYSLDRTRGTHPIKRPLTNMDQASALYDNIIYCKTVMMMYQLEDMMGAEKFRNALREYLKTYAFGNCTWESLLDIFQKYTERDVISWSKVWVSEAGRPKFKYQLSQKDGKINKFALEQTDETGGDKVWPQKFSILLVYNKENKKVTIEVDARTKVTDIKEVKDLSVPDMVVFNSDGRGYGLFPLWETLPTDLHAFQDSVTRYCMLINLFENMIDTNAKVSPVVFLNQVSGWLKTEHNGFVVSYMCNRLKQTFWQYLNETQKKEQAPAYEARVLDATRNNKGNNKELFKLLYSTAWTKETSDMLYRIWLKKDSIAELKPDRSNYTSIAYELALRGYDYQELLDTQLKRIENVDSKNAFMLNMLALHPLQAKRDSLFESFTKETDRATMVEGYIVAAVGWLNHPLHYKSSVHYLERSIKLVPELKRTGAVFFPSYWLNSILKNYQTSEAEDIVNNFLKNPPADLDDLHKQKILQEADGLFRANRVARKSYQ